MNQELKYPFYIRLAVILLSLGIIFSLLYCASGILIPVLLALFFAILLRPVVFFLNEKLRFPHVIAVIIAVVVLILLIGGVLFFVSWKIGDIADDWGKIKTNINIHSHHIQQWIKQSFNISYKEQQKYVEEASKNSFQGSEMIGSTMSSFTDIILNFLLVPIYTFLFLIYRNLFLKFLSKLVKKENQSKLNDILFQIKIAIQSYLVGILIEVSIVSILVASGFMIIGVEYAILLGVITGVLNLIPYLGIMIAGTLSIVATLTTSTDIHLVLGVVIVNIIVQLLDNNILVPFIVSSKVKINAFVSILGIIIGGALAGVAGMFLAIPLIAILKVIFDRIEDLESWGFLMGDDLPKTYQWGKVKLPRYDYGNSSDEQTPSDEKREQPKEEK